MFVVCFGKICGHMLPAGQWLGSAQHDLPARKLRAMLEARGISNHGEALSIRARTADASALGSSAASNSATRETLYQLIPWGPFKLTERRAWFGDSADEETAVRRAFRAARLTKGACEALRWARGRRYRELALIRSRPN